jgi:hypothetical protein
VNRVPERDRGLGGALGAPANEGPVPAALVSQPEAVRGLLDREVSRRDRRIGEHEIRVTAAPDDDLRLPLGPFESAAGIRAGGDDEHGDGHGGRGRLLLTGDGRGGGAREQALHGHREGLLADPAGDDRAIVRRRTPLVPDEVDADPRAADAEDVTVAEIRVVGADLGLAEPGPVPRRLVVEDVVRPFALDRRVQAGDGRIGERDVAVRQTPDRDHVAVRRVDHPAVDTDLDREHDRLIGRPLRLEPVLGWRRWWRRHRARGEDRGLFRFGLEDLRALGRRCGRNRGTERGAAETDDVAVDEIVARDSLARPADERAVRAAEIDDGMPALGGLDLRVAAGDARVGDDDVARGVAADDEHLRPERDLDPGRRAVDPDELRAVDRHECLSNRARPRCGSPRTPRDRPRAECAP